MLKRLLYLILIIFLCCGPAWAGQDILVVQSMRVTPYEEAYRGFKDECGAGIKRFVLSELEEKDLLKKIYAMKPDMVLAIGMGALSKVKKIREVPVVYIMVVNPEAILSPEVKNFTGVGMNIPLERQLNALTRALPDINSIGLLYDPKKTGLLAGKVRDAAAEKGIKLISKEIHRSWAMPLSLSDMKGKIDIFWMLPDVTVFTPETIEFLFLFSLENKIPVLTFSDKYLGLGALMSIGIDNYDIGKQAGELANGILSGKNTTMAHIVDARKAAISINMKVAKKLGKEINKELGDFVPIEIIE